MVSFPSCKPCSKLCLTFWNCFQFSECRCGSTGCIGAWWVCKDGNDGHWCDGDGWDNCSSFQSSLRRMSEPRRASETMVEIEVSAKSGFAQRPEMIAQIVRILTSCSVIFLFIFIYYNNEQKSVALHSHSENYIFFHIKKHPPSGGCKKMVKKLKNIVSLFVFFKL